MKRISLSIFLLIMASIIGINLASPLIVEKPLKKILYATHIYSNFWRNLFRGGYHLVTKNLEALPPEEWDHYIRRQQIHFGYPITLDNIRQLPLSSAERRRLMDGEIVVRQGITIFHQRVAESDRVVTMKLSHDYYDKETTPHEDRELTRGIYHLLLEDLKALPPGKWQAYIRQMQPYFGYPLTLDEIDGLSLFPLEKKHLMDGEIVVKKDGLLFHRRAFDSHKSLTMGPIELAHLELWVESISWTIVTMAFGIMAMVWALPFWLKLKKIILAARAFGRGDFDARATVPKTSALAPLAGTFNDMAGRIQQLIASHRELTRAVSHELRTPISRIRFGLEMARTAGDEADRMDFLAEIGLDVDELEALVAELLVYARFDRESPELEKKELPLAPWLIQTVNTAGNGFSQISISCRIAPEAANLTAAIASRYMARALSNLITNAARYAKSQVVVNLEQNDQAIIIRVDDDGPGIPEADREKIFEPFVRIDASRDRDTGGHGLGLAIVKRIVGLHQGRVWVESSPLGGARFVICWPPSKKE